MDALKEYSSDLDSFDSLDSLFPRLPLIRGWVSLVAARPRSSEAGPLPDMLRVAWDNRDELPFAWRILRDGVCDGCALGTSGFATGRSGDAPLHGAARAAAAQHRAGARSAVGSPTWYRCASPDVEAAARARPAAGADACAARGEPGFTVIAWDEALDMRRRAPSRASTRARRVLSDLARHHQRVYYVAQKAARAATAPTRRQLGAPVPRGLDGGDEERARPRRLDLQLRRLDRAPTSSSSSGRTRPTTSRSRRSTCTTPTRRRHARSPSSIRSASPGSSATGCRRSPRARCSARGSPITGSTCTPAATWRSSSGVLKALLETRRLSIASSSRGAHDGLRGGARRGARRSRGRTLEAESGASRRRHASASRGCSSIGPNAIFVWSMGLTQHVHGVDTIRRCSTWASRAACVGRPHRGLMPIRGHSGVQGGAEVGCMPVARRGDARSLVARCGASRRPTDRGLTAAGDGRRRRGRRHRRLLDGGRQLPRDAGGRRCARARRCGGPRLRVHQDIVLSSSMLVEPADTVLVLPATTRYETPGGGTETTTERRIVFSPEIEGRRIGSARPEWGVFRRRDCAACGPERGRRAARLQTPAPSAPRSRARFRSTPASRRCAPRATRCSGAGRASSTTAGSRRADGTAHFCVPCGCARRARSSRHASSCRRAAASSSTRWCSATSIRSPARRATPC